MQAGGRRRNRRKWLAVAGLLASLWTTRAYGGNCPAKPIRWQDDCSGLAGENRADLERLRYVPLTSDGAFWLSLGGEARVRLEQLDAADFGAAGGPQYLQLGRRVLAHADLHREQGGRLFMQLGLAEENGRRPGPRAHDQDQLDVTQLFLDAPLDLGVIHINARVGRQEINLSDNRLVTTRDGVNMRRSFDGGLAEVRVGGVRLTAFGMHPVEIRRGAFDDRANGGETFAGLSLDLPRGGGLGLTTLYLFDRQRDNAVGLEGVGPERRWTAGMRHARRGPGWELYAQGAWQWGEAAAGDIRAYGGWIGATRAGVAPLPWRVGASLAYSTGDRASGDGRVETFDPIYPSSSSVGESPLLYPANHVVGAAEAAVRTGAVEWGAAAHLVGRASSKDTIWAQGRPMPHSVGGARSTATLIQLSARAALSSRMELYLSAVRAFAGKGVRNAGGRDASYLRLQFTSRL